MGTSINYDKKIYERSELGKLEARIRRFLNIEKLANAINNSPEGTKIQKLRQDSQKEFTKLTDDFSKIELKFKEEEKKYNAKLESTLIKYMKQEVDIMNNFEKNFNN